MMQHGGGLSAHFARHLERQALLDAGDRVVVALSGGVDSLTLLHLLRFAPGIPPLDLLAAHFDHRMREESGGEAQWVQGVCHAWQVPLHRGCATGPLRSEEEAREARYEFLQRILVQEEARWLLTAHHADDQAETVLFRILRGTGLRGLAGIPTHRPPGLYRPLLPFTRAELEAYAADRGLRPRRDPSNRSLSRPRSVLRHSVLPSLEEKVAPGARGALRRLAHLASENEEAWRSLLPRLLDGVVEDREEGIVVVRSALLAYHPAVQTRVLREVLRRRGIRLGEAGTRTLLEFTRTGASGRGLPLPGGTVWRRAFDRFHLEEDPGAPEEIPLEIPGLEEGTGRVVVGGRELRCRWGTGEPPAHRHVFQASARGLVFPLSVRGWRAGDRVRMSYGTKKVKKLLGEARVPVVERQALPVLSDARDRVLWVVGVTDPGGSVGEDGAQTFFLGIDDGVQR